MTAFLAFVSSSYSFYSIFSIESDEVINPDGKQIFTPVVLLASLSLGFVWAMFIFFMDRFIISTISKSDSIGTQIAMAIPRLLIASLISLTLSQPVEIWIFHHRIRHTINFMEKAAIDKELLAEKTRLAEIEKDKMTAMGRRTSEFGNDSRTDSSIVAKTNDLRDESSEINLRNEVLSRQVQRDNDEIDAIHADSFMLPDQKGLIIQNLRQKIERSTAEIARNRREYRKHVDKLDISKEHLDEKHEQVLSDINKQVADLEKKRESAIQEKRLREEIEKKRNKMAFSENIITQLDALHGYLNGIDIAEDDAKALEHRKSMQRIYLVIVLLFFLFESAPVIAKLIIPSGEYDMIATHEKNNLQNELENHQKMITEFNQFFFDHNKQEDLSLYKTFLEKIRENRLKLVTAIVSDHGTKPLSMNQLYQRLSHQFFHELPIQDIQPWMIPREDEIKTEISDVKGNESFTHADVVREAKAIEVTNLQEIKGKRTTRITFFRGIFVWSKWRKDIDDVWDDSRKEFIKDGLKLAGYSSLYLAASAITAHYTNIAVAGSGSFILIILQFLSNRSKSVIQKTVGMPDQNAKS